MRIIVAGIGTNVGKTVVSAILTQLFGGDYWKPIECGDSDTDTLKKWIGSSNRIHRPAYCFKAPLSPHLAAHLENRSINVEEIVIPQAIRPLIIEGVGGVLVPLTTSILSLDLFKSWNCQWIIVSKHYLGSINHTLLTIEILKKHDIPILGIIFNGELNLDHEDVILEMTRIPFLGRLQRESCITPQILQKYGRKWRLQLQKISSTFGILSHK